MKKLLNLQLPVFLSLTLVVATTLFWFHANKATAALNPTNLTASGSASAATSYATASITPSANALILASVYNINTTAPNTPTLTGNSLAWVLVGTENDGTNNKGWLFRAMGSPTSGTVTIDFAGQSQTGGIVWIITQFTGTDTSGTNGSGAVVQFASSGACVFGTSQTVTMGAFSSAKNGTYGSTYITTQTNETISSTNMTKIQQTNVPDLMEDQWSSGNVSAPQWSWASSHCEYMMAIEVQPAPPPITPHTQTVINKAQAILTKGKLIVY